MEQGSMNEIVGLFLQAETSKTTPPPNMSKWQILNVAASQVGLDISEVVGLAHLLMGHASTPEVTALLHEIMRRQKIMPFGIDRFIQSLFVIAFAKSDQAVMRALQELNISQRFLSMMGLGRIPPRYISEEMLIAANIKHPEVLRARLEVPFRYQDNPGVWDEWLDKAALCCRGFENVGTWRHIKAHGPIVAAPSAAETGAAAAAAAPSASGDAATASMVFSTVLGGVARSNRLGDGITAALDMPMPPARRGILSGLKARQEKRDEDERAEEARRDEVRRKMVLKSRVGNLRLMVARHELKASSDGAQSPKGDGLEEPITSAASAVAAAGFAARLKKKKKKKKKKKNKVKKKKKKKKNTQNKKKKKTTKKKKLK
eukprot:NODE_10624_length_1339_cov_3.435644.p1 GENE.NODE_10624_length_1339_cov_3.435644~~NODE_10624_length_1339_cov_3.435644.p1  ORF type:complete len:429 (-),score=155.74 NODE_10624_length_1339_cov_3.435644:53-1174(-)